MEQDFIGKARQLTRRIAELDKRHVVFGARQHRYRFPARLPEQKVLAFERRYDVSLPTPYRRFLTELGNGGPGPFHGIEPLPKSAPQITFDFPAIEAFKAERGDEDVSIPGGIHIVDYGCGVSLVLVLRGEAAGQVWWDNLGDDEVSPVLDPDGHRVTFDSFWLGHMEPVLKRFEEIFSMMKQGMDHEAIHEALDPTTLQLDVDDTMLSLMNEDPDGKPSQIKDKPWGVQCGLVEDHYPRWLAREARRRRIGSTRLAKFLRKHLARTKTE